MKTINHFINNNFKCFQSRGLEATNCPETIKITAKHIESNLERERQHNQMSITIERETLRCLETL